MLDLLRDADEVHVLAAAGWTLDLQVIPVILVEPLQTLDEQEVDREPCSRRNDSGSDDPANERWVQRELTYRASPIGISTKHPGLRFPGPVIDFVALSVDIHTPRVVLVLFRQAAKRSKTCQQPASSRNSSPQR